MPLVLPGKKYFNLWIWDNNFYIEQKKEGKVIDELKELIQLAQWAVEILERAERLRDELDDKYDYEKTISNIASDIIMPGI